MTAIEGNVLFQGILDNYHTLIREKEDEGHTLVSCGLGNDNNLHLMFFRHYDESYVVWTSYITENKETSLFACYNGAYDLSVKDAHEELTRRLKK